MIEFMEMTFPGGPREVRRIIVRSITDISVHKLREGKFTLYQNQNTAEIPFELATGKTCCLN